MAQREETTIHRRSERVPREQMPPVGERDMRIQAQQQPRRRRRKEDPLELPRFSGKRQPEQTPPMRRREGGPGPNRPQKKGGNHRMILRIFLILIAIACVGALAYLLIRVNSISVEGLHWKDPDAVIQLSGIEQGDNILLLNKAQIKENIEADPHFIFVNVRYRFPTGVTISVKERQEAACFAFANTYVIVDQNGMILGHVEKSQGTSLPKVLGVEVTEFVLGAEIRTTDTYKQDALREVLGALCERELQQAVEQIDLSHADQIWLQLKDGTKVCLGQSIQLREKLEWLEKITEKIHEEGYVGGTIDLTSAVAPVYIPADKDARPIAMEDSLSQDDSDVSEGEDDTGDAAQKDDSASAEDADTESDGQTPPDGDLDEE